jgi:putative aminopeptidase FrvX
VNRRALTMLLSAFVPCTALVAQRPITVRDAERVLAPLVEAYGVSGTEGPVRDLVQRQLPKWARAETDTAGNLWVTAGSGEPLVVFVAHLDEIGFEVKGIRDDGQLLLDTRGGFFPSLYEAEPALVHSAGRIVPGVFTPRDSLVVRRNPGELRVDVGTADRAATEALGIGVGATVTMPKRYVRLAGTRATGRSFDDRVGCAALLLALQRLDPSKLHHAVTFIFSVREEIGLEGAAAAARALGLRPARVHAIDTFVSSDAPLEP